MPDFETSECYTKQSCSYQASLNYLQHHSKTKALKSICKMPCEFSDILHMQWEKKVEKTENAPFGIVAIVQASLCHWKKQKQWWHSFETRSLHLDQNEEAFSPASHFQQQLPLKGHVHRVQSRNIKNGHLKPDCRSQQPLASSSGHLPSGMQWEFPCTHFKYMSFCFYQKHHLIQQMSACLGFDYS